MKISSSIRKLYDLQYDINILLEARVKEIFTEAKKDNWFYKARVKKLESFAQKLETGRFIPDALEDFFGCTIVVENQNVIKDALILVESFCAIKYKRPGSFDETHKSPELFSFDDLRLYVKLKPAESGPPLPINEVLFEVQIKTFLQHAWSIATHDLIYKGDTISWSKARLAFQIKAMLEHAEISIEQVENIANSSLLSMVDPKTKSLTEITAWLKSQWVEEEQLPADVVRLSRTTFELLAGLRMNLSDLIDAVSKDTSQGLGTNQKNLSPYEIIVKAVLNNKKGELMNFLTNKKISSRLRLFITPEMEVDELIKVALPARYIKIEMKDLIMFEGGQFSKPPFVYEKSVFKMTEDFTIVAVQVSDTTMFNSSTNAGSPKKLN